MILGNVDNSAFCFKVQVVAMASISTSTSFGSFAAWMQVLAGFGDGSNYFQRWNSLSLGGAFPFLPFHTPRSSQKSYPYLSNTRWLWQPSPMMNLQPPRRFRDSWCIEPVENTIEGLKAQKQYVHTVCSLIPPSTIFPVLSAGVWPLRKIRPGTLVAWASNRVCC